MHLSDRLEREALERIQSPQIAREVGTMELLEVMICQYERHPPMTTEFYVIA